MPDLQIDSSQRDPRNAASGTRGRISHDPRGTAVWDWAIATGVLAKATPEQLLNALGDASTLSLEASLDRSNGWSGDPYNRTFELKGRFPRTR